jgi:anti-anti-sigma factor
MSHEFRIVSGEETEMAAVARVTGRLDAKNAQELLRHAREARERGKKRLIINLAQVSFVASSGVGTLLALTEEFQDAGGAVHLVALSEAVRSVIELLNLTQFLNIGENEQEALQTLGA